jgi:aminomethyltransferase
VSPWECGLGWTVALEPANRDFIGREALIQQKKNGIKNQLVGLILKDKGIMRSKQSVKLANEEAGYITSGTYSPSLKQSIALARLPLTSEKEVCVDIRGRLVLAQIVKPRFITPTK